MVPSASPAGAEAPALQPVTLCINGVEHTQTIDTRPSLLDLLRETRVDADSGEMQVARALACSRLVRPSTR